MLPKHGERRNLLTTVERYDRPSFAWIGEEEWQRRQWDREDRIFAKAANQGQLTAPMIMSDSLGLHGVQSQVDGQRYDSKSTLRRHYRQSGMVEVGNDVPKTRFVHGDKPERDPQTDRKQWDALHKAANRIGLPA